MNKDKLFSLSRERLCLFAMVLVLATVFAYRPAWDGGFVWDDDFYVTKNRLLTEPDGLRRIWFSLESPSQYFPLTYASFRIERMLGSKKAMCASPIAALQRYLLNAFPGRFLVCEGRE